MKWAVIEMYGSAEKLNGENRLRGRSLLGGVALCVALASGAALAQDTSPAGTGGVTGDQIKQILGLERKGRKRVSALGCISSWVSCWR